jgi:WD40 repeat protein
MPGVLPSRFIISAGTYDGCVAGWDSAKNPKKLLPPAADLSPTRGLPPTPSSSPLPLSFAMSSHSGSVRVVSVPSCASASPPLMFSFGADQVLRLYDLALSVEIGETRLPPDIPGLVTSGSFAGAAHLLVGTAEGKLVLYDARTLSVQHVMGGHAGPVSCVSAHPSGAMALTCGEQDGTVRLWDLTRGRCTYVSRVKSEGAGPQTVRFSPSGKSYCYSHGHTHVTAKDTVSGEVLLDVDLEDPRLRVNDLCYLGPDEGYVALGLNNGGLCLMRLNRGGGEEIRAAMVVEGGGSVKGGGAGSRR